jgi:hypothetical protein
MAFSLINPLYPRPHITAGAGNAISSGVMLTVSSTSSATAFTASQFASDVQLLFWDIQGGNVLITIDGTTPSSNTRGHQFVSGTNYTWQLETLIQSKFLLPTGGTTAYIFASQIAI